MDPFIGEIRMIGFNFAPRGWALCNGQLMGVQQNQALFVLIGTTYGGNGQTTFGMPDLRSRVPVHANNGSAVSGLSTIQLGEKAGEENHALLVTEMPPHSHQIGASNSDATSNRPGGRVPARGGAYADSFNTTGTPSFATGGGIPHNIRQPYLGLNFIIALEGLFPSRN